MKASFSGTKGNSEVNELELNGDPSNEYSTQYIALLAFPCLFPDAKGDPTNNAILRQISDSETDSFAQNLSI